jgi:Tol biopolymer transport system component
LKDDRFISSKVYPVWFAHDVYILRYHCGSPCAGFASQNYFGESLWFEGSTTGFVDFAATDNFMILAGHTDVPPPYSSTLDEINLLTGEKRVIWEAPSDGDYFTPFFDPSISPDEQFIAFNYGGGPHVQEVTYVLYVIDRNGQEIGQYPRSSFVDWRPNGELTINRILESDVNQLVNLTASGESQIIFTTEPGTFLAKVAFYEKGDGKWSPDGRYFIFTTENYEKDLTQLYVWLSETEEVRLVLTEDQDYGSQFIWLPDSTAFYFIINGVIWRYEMETAD